MKVAHARKASFRRVIHLSIRASKIVPMKKRKNIATASHSTARTINKSQAQLSFTTNNSQNISNYRTYSTRDTWANPHDYRILHEQTNNNKKKKYLRPRNIVISVAISLGLILTVIVPSVVLLTQSKPKRRSGPAVLRWNTTGTTVAGVTGQRGNASNKLNSPWGLCIDWSSTLYIADQQNNRVQRYLKNESFGETVAGDSTGLTGGASNRLQSLLDVTLDPNGNIYVVDSDNQRIQLWNKSASTGITIAGVTGTTGNALNLLENPYGIAYNHAKKTIYVSDSDNYRIMSYYVGVTNGTIAAGGNGIGTNNNQLKGSYGIYFDEASNSLIIANNAANNIVRWTLGASSWTLIAGAVNGASGNTSSRFNFPTDVVLDPIGNVYVADYFNNRVQFFPVGETVGMTIAGITGITGNDSSLLGNPTSIVLDNQLNLYVSDRWNHRVQKFKRY